MNHVNAGRRVNESSVKLRHYEHRAVAHLLQHEAQLQHHRITVGSIRQRVSEAGSGVICAALGPLT